MNEVLKLYTLLLNQIAMHFVKDVHIRFNLAIECGNLVVAKEMALQINDADCWCTLADVAMKHGNIQVMITRVI